MKHIELPIGTKFRYLKREKFITLKVVERRLGRSHCSDCWANGTKEHKDRLCNEFVCFSQYRRDGKDVLFRKVNDGEED